ncbi:glycosyltransferase family 2 protein, partial [Providencia sp. wls1950]|uniref:glycosyltransferase family 2 protein n=1 Tax=Providencia sp. wls1950 TaxID=2675147 RepID=UPI0012B594C1
KMIGEYNDPRLKYYHQNNSGVSIARNTGFKISTGEFVIFLDSDDNVIEGQLDIFSHAISEKQNYDIYFTSYNFWYSEKNTFKIREKIPTGEYNNFFLDCISGIQPCFSGCVCIRRRILEKRMYIFEPKCNFGEDQKLWIELFHEYKCYSLPNTTMNYRVHTGESLSKNKVTQLPPDIEIAINIKNNNSMEYAAYRLSAFSIIAIQNKNLKLLKKILQLCIKNKLATKYTKFLFSRIVNKLTSIK